MVLSSADSFVRILHFNWKQHKESILIKIEPLYLRALSQNGQCFTEFRYYFRPVHSYLECR